MRITRNENKVLRAIASNCFNDCNYDMPDTYERAGSSVWSWLINDAGEPSGIEGKALSGVVASLNKKGLAVSQRGENAKDDTVYMTEAGFDAMINFKGEA